MTWTEFHDALYEIAQEKGDTDILEALSRNLFVFSSEISTMATNGKNIFVNPDFAASLTIEEIRGVIYHELLHIFYKHTTQPWQIYDSKSGIPEGLWHNLTNIATDIVIDEELRRYGITLPEGAIYRETFDIPDHIPNVSATIFAEILKIAQDEYSKAKQELEKAIEDAKREEAEQQAIANKPQTAPTSSGYAPTDPHIQAQDSGQEGDDEGQDDDEEKEGGEDQDNGMSAPGGKPKPGGSSSNSKGGSSSSSSSGSPDENAPATQEEIDKLREEIEERQKELDEQQAELDKQKEEIASRGNSSGNQSGDSDDEEQQGSGGAGQKDGEKEDAEASDGASGDNTSDGDGTSDDGAETDKASGGDSSENEEEEGVGGGNDSEQKSKPTIADIARKQAALDAMREELQKQLDELNKRQQELNEGNQKSGQGSSSTGQSSKSNGKSSQSSNSQDGSNSGQGGEEDSASSSDGEDSENGEDSSASSSSADDDDELPEEINLDDPNRETKKSSGDVAPHSGTPGRGSIGQTDYDVEPAHDEGEEYQPDFTADDLAASIANKVNRATGLRDKVISRKALPRTVERRPVNIPIRSWIDRVFDMAGQHLARINYERANNGRGRRWPMTISGVDLGLEPIPTPGKRRRSRKPRAYFYVDISGSMGGPWAYFDKAEAIRLELCSREALLSETESVLIPFDDRVYEERKLSETLVGLPRGGNDMDRVIADINSRPSDDAVFVLVTDLEYDFNVDYIDQDKFVIVVTDHLNNVKFTPRDGLQVIGVNSF